MDTLVPAEKLVKVYDVDRLIREETKDSSTPMQAHGTCRVAVLCGPRGIIVTDREAVHVCLKSETDTVDVDCCPAQEEGARTFLVFPTHQIKLTVAEVMQAPASEVRLGAFVRRFGTRLEANYCVLLDSIREIGLDPANYPRNEVAA